MKPIEKEVIPNTSTPTTAIAVKDNEVFFSQVFLGDDKVVKVDIMSTPLTFTNVITDVGYVEDMVFYRDYLFTIDVDDKIRFLKFN